MNKKGLQKPLIKNKKSIIESVTNTHWSHALLCANRKPESTHIKKLNPQINKSSPSVVQMKPSDHWAKSLITRPTLEITDWSLGSMD